VKLGKLALMAGKAKGRGHLWALGAPILMVVIAWLVGLLIWDVFGAGYLTAFFGRLMHLVHTGNNG